MIKAIIWDMDGVLADSEPLHFEVEEIIFSKLGIPVTLKERDGFVGLAADLMWEYIKKTYNLQQSIKELMVYDSKIREKYFKDSDKLLPSPGIEKLLEMFREHNFPMAVASSSSPEIINIITGKLKLNKYFIHTVSGDTVNKGKPAPDIFLKTASLLGFKPENCLVIEDSLNGIRGAKTAGMYCGAYCPDSAQSSIESHADFLIKDFTEESPETLTSRIIL